MHCRSNSISLSSTRRKGIIDVKGNRVLDNAYNDIKIINETLFGIKVGQLYDVINSDDQIVLSGISRIKKNNIAKKDDKWGVLGANGSWLIQPNEEFINPGHAHHYIVKRNGAYGLFNTINKTWQKWDASKIKYLQEDRYAIYKQGVWFLADTSGDVLQDTGYASVYPFTEGIAAFSINDYWGYFDRNGDVIIDAIFALPWKCSEGKFRLFAGRGFGFHDAHGEVIIQPRFDDVRDFSEGMAAYAVD